MRLHLVGLTCSLALSSSGCADGAGTHGTRVAQPASSTSAQTKAKRAEPPTEPAIDPEPVCDAEAERLAPGRWCEQRYARFAGVQQIAAGRSLRCLLRRTGEVLCRGKHEGPTDKKYVHGDFAPVDIPGRVISIAFHYNRLVAVSDTGRLLGTQDYLSKQFDQLASGSFIARAVIGDGAGLCAVEKTGSVACLRVRDGKEVVERMAGFDGAPRIVIDRNSRPESFCAEWPGERVVCDGGVKPPEGATAVALGNGFACFVVGGEVRCEGRNAERFVGQDQRSGLRHPAVGGKVDRIWSWSDGICARTTEGHVYCAGYLERKREIEPDGKTIRVVYVPREAKALRGATSLSVGSSSVCAIVDGQVVCAGFE